MKAFLLAAGIGSRLRPITEKIPKCLVPIDGKPLLYHWLKLFEQHHIDEVLINVHHLPDLIFEFFEMYSFQVKVHTVFEQELLGSAGTVRNNFDFVCQEQNFLICYADNLTNLNLTRMIKFHQRQRPIATIGLFQTENPTQCGIAELAEDCTIIEFIEKPSHPKSNLAGAGIYVVNHQIWHYLPDRYPSDFGFDVLPQLVGKMKGYLIKEYFIDVGTVENYERARKEFPLIKRSADILAKS
ncbi:MAG: nucleotidyltransferase family protein [candidate division KSB1 bacterium]|nr:nucleotidyltransferase family protein [candidate division KSB1 bacterium]MDZ7335960.1 nucleotidyltransferase family protein [candidate division KSB1 bacterium]MDZ7357926.1 nucleotidyltransferase family protein [candidate division KSB1 bacterium]MDZ7402181.1 nucleotidyltransferase family protein [candidate division KSB1 bacterium]